jgi:hypothetical protein
MRTRGKTKLNFSEKNLGRVFKTELEKQKYFLILGEGEKQFYTTYRVYLNKPVRTQSKKFIRFWKAEGLDPADIPPSQPEVDMILEGDKGDMRAVELKVIRKYKQGIRPSYYQGIGQTLAYLSFGFPQVALWLCFDGDSMEDKEIYRYNDAFSKIIFPLKPFVATTQFKILSLGQTLKMQNRIWNGQKSWWENGIGLPMNGTHSINWNASNLFLSGFRTPEGPMQFAQETSKPARTIYEFLKMQREFWKR